MALREVTLQVPEELVGEFYARTDAWLRGDNPEKAKLSSKYAILALVLQQQRQDVVRFSFQELEARLGFELPPSARQHRTWWGNTPQHPQSRAWMWAGWRAKLHAEEQAVTFTRSARPFRGRRPRA